MVPGLISSRLISVEMMSSKARLAKPVYLTSSSLAGPLESAPCLMDEAVDTVLFSATSFRISCLICL